MTDPISGSRSLLPPDPFADTAEKPSPRSAADQALLPPDPFVTVDYRQLGRTMAVGATPHNLTQTVGEQLDATRGAYSGPYQVHGQSVMVAPQFRMNGGINQRAIFNVDVPSQRDARSFQQSLTNHGRVVFDVLVRAGVANPASVMLGYGSPAALVKATQALCDAGKLPTLAPPATLGDCIRKMQWDCGIGVDCVDYTMHALSKINGRSIEGLGLTPGVDPFSADGKRCPPQFTRASVLSARPGDVMTLSDPGDVGHRVVVRDHTTADAETKRSLAQRWGTTAAAFFKGDGPFHVLTVDSSWGAGDGQPYGGARTDTWVFDAGSKSWLSFSHHENRTLVGTKGPAGETLAGTYRWGGR